jgi:hypothetical protein
MPYRPVPIGVAILVSACTVCAVISPILGLRLVLIAGLTTGAGSLIFPWYYCCLVLAVDLYTLRVVERAVALSLVWVFVVSVLMGLVGFLPAAPLSQHEHAYHVVMDQAPLLMYESLGTLALGSFVVTIVAARGRSRLGDRHRAFCYYWVPLLGLTVHVIVGYMARYLPLYDPVTVLALIKDRLLFAVFYQVACVPLMLLFAWFVPTMDDPANEPHLLLPFLARWARRP